MGASTIGRIDGYVKPEDIVCYLKRKYGKSVNGVKTYITDLPDREKIPYFMAPGHKSDTNRIEKYGHIDFTDGKDARSLFYSHSNIKYRSEQESYEEQYLDEMAAADTTYLSLGFWNDSVNIIKDIVIHFGGGWIHENDCGEDKPYYLYTENHDSDDGTFRCKKCRGSIFAAHQVCHMDIIVNGKNQFERNVKGGADAGIYEAGEPFGPYVCINCGAEYEELE